VSCGTFPRHAAQSRQAMQINDKLANKCPESLPYTSEEIADKVRSLHQQALGRVLADLLLPAHLQHRLPTCYCFDVQDNWNLDQVSGRRARLGRLLLEDFARNLLGAGACENFRSTAASVTATG
jgi:hypothetical protein